MAKRDNKEQDSDVRGTLLSLLWREKDGDVSIAPFFLALMLILAIAGGLWFWLGSGSEEMAIEEPADTEEVYGGPRHALTGMPTDEAIAPGVFAVMVENSLDARPQAGVEHAFLVYEAPVEGNITRWMALFSADQEVDEIGPVRSARPYYVDWAQAWDALYAHVGGSPQALEQISSQGGVWDVNEFFWTSTFWRARHRSAPHNVYTESARLVDAWDEAVDEEIAYDKRLFADGESQSELGMEVTVPFNGPAYDVAWEYDPETNRYTRRLQSSRAHTMASGEALMADNIAILFTEIDTIDAVGRKDLETVGEGEALILQNGVVIEGTWEKTSRDALERFYDADGEEILWNPGVTWVQAVWNGTDIEIEQEEMETETGA